MVVIVHQGDQVLIRLRGVVVINASLSPVAANFFGAIYCEDGVTSFL